MAGYLSNKRPRRELTRFERAFDWMEYNLPPVLMFVILTCASAFVLCWIIFVPKRFKQ